MKPFYITLDNLHPGLVGLPLNSLFRCDPLHKHGRLALTVRTLAGEPDPSALLIAQRQALEKLRGPSGRFDGPGPQAIEAYFVPDEAEATPEPGSTSDSPSPLQEKPHVD